MSIESITLYYSEGNSDKVYQASIEAQGNGYMVNFAYGRRGSSLKAGSKTSAPVDLPKAKSIYAKLISEKTSKGYAPGADGTPIVPTSFQERDSGLRPQLLNPIEEAEADRCIQAPSFWMQEKHDGERLMVQKKGDKIEGINRKGLVRALPKTILDHAESIRGDFVLDGEVIGDKMFAFDLVQAGPYSVRLPALEALLDHPGAISVVKTAKTHEEKRDMFDALKKANAEGAVFKDKTAQYKAGRPDSGGSQLKFKFYETASVFVSDGRAGKRSVGMHVLDKGRWVDVGNVTIPPNADIPKAGQIIEVRYLYAYRGGALYQPTFLMVRTDLDIADCGISQLKYKRD